MRGKSLVGKPLVGKSLVGKAIGRARWQAGTQATGRARWQLGGQGKTGKQSNRPGQAVSR
jgi:hypothetical protein